MPNTYTLETSVQDVISDSQHGTRGGGTLHANATTSVAGFMSATDKTKLDGIPAGGGLVQSRFREITVDTTTTSPTFVTLLTDTITIGAGRALIIQFLSSMSNSNSNNIVYARIQVNGVTYRGAATTAQNTNRSGAVCIQTRVTGLAAGTHTVTVQWRVSGGTGQVRVVSQPDTESASMLIEEVSV